MSIFLTNENVVVLFPGGRALHLPPSTYRTCAININYITGRKQTLLNTCIHNKTLTTLSKILKYETPFSAISTITPSNSFEQSGTTGGELIFNTYTSVCYYKIPFQNNLLKKSYTNVKFIYFIINHNYSKWPPFGKGFTTSQAFFVSARKQIPDCQRLNINLVQTRVPQIDFI